MQHDHTPCVYVITNLVSGRQYVGCSVRPQSRWTAHRWRSRRSPRFPLHRAMANHGVDAFRFEIIEHCRNAAEMLERERLWIEVLGTLHPGGYNLTVGGEGVPGYQPSPELIARRAASICGTRWTDEARRRYSEQCKSRPVEHRQKISAALTGKSPTEATRQKLRTANLGKQQSAETIEKRVAKLRGRSHTEQARANMSAAQQGRAFAPGHRANISRTLAKLTDAQAAIVRFDALQLQGQEYAALFGVSEQTISGIRRGRTYRHVTSQDLH